MTSFSHTILSYIYNVPMDYNKNISTTINVPSSSKSNPVKIQNMDFIDEAERQVYETELNRRNLQMFKLIYTNIIKDKSFDSDYDFNLEDSEKEIEKIENETVTESDDEEETDSYQSDSRDEIQIFQFED